MSIFIGRRRREKMRPLTTYIDTISGPDAQHAIDPEKVEEIYQALQRGDDLPLPLVVEDIGNGALVLDGHHRIAAREQAGEYQMDAHVVDRTEFEQLIEKEFDGEIPSRLEDLDEFIIVDGETYQRPRSPNDIS